MKRRPCVRVRLPGQVYRLVEESGWMELPTSDEEREMKTAMDRGRMLRRGRGYVFVVDLEPNMVVRIGQSLEVRGEFLASMDGVQERREGRLLVMWGRRLQTYD